MRSAWPPVLDKLGRGAPVSVRGVGGGCIAAAAIARFADGSEVFVKTAQGVAGLFACEAEGLRVLAAAEAIRVPKVLAVGADALVLERISEGARPPEFFETFGRAFAALHGQRGRACGFWQDNFIGATPQPNAPLQGCWEDAADDGSGWPAFFLERRLRFQVRLAADRGQGDELLRLLDRAEPGILERLAEAIEAPRLLHGDLWGGNFLVDERGEACLIDPAVYFGHREADLAMTRLFGGFAPAFYAAYEEAAPLAPGHEDRLPLYQLYHLLNHGNLFGAGYFERARRILHRHARG